MRRSSRRDREAAWSPRHRIRLLNVALPAHAFLVEHERCDAMWWRVHHVATVDGIMSRYVKSSQANLEQIRSDRQTDRLS